VKTIQESVPRLWDVIEDLTVSSLGWTCFCDLLSFSVVILVFEYISLIYCFQFHLYAVFADNFIKLLGMCSFNSLYNFDVANKKEIRVILHI